MNLIDSHCHLPNLQQKDELDKIIADAQDWGVDGFINIGTSTKDNQAAIYVAEQHESIYATVAIYPNEHQGENIVQLMNRLKEQAKSSKKVVAIGECGIDISDWKNQRPLDEQIKLFELHIEVALELNLPLAVHNRGGDSIIPNILSRYKNARGVVHCFSSGWETAKKFLDLGFYVSFSGFITYPSRFNLLETVKNVPADSYLIETDSPYLLPEPARSEVRATGIKEKNDPKYVKIVAQKVAQARQINLKDVALQTRNNTRQLFALTL